MFVVGTVQREVNAEDTTQFTFHWPVVLEDEVAGYVGGQVALRDSREAAQKLADDLNAVLDADN